MAEIFDGRALAQAWQDYLMARFGQTEARLAWIMIGDDQASVLYGRLKQKLADRCGIGFQKFQFAAGVDLAQVLACVDDLNQDPGVTGVMVQLPMPGFDLDQQLQVLNRMAVTKDVDCLTAENLGLIIQGKPRVLPATVRAVMVSLGFAWNVPHQQLFGSMSLELLADKLSGRRVAVVGGGLEVGRPLVNWLSQLGASVIWLRSKESNLAEMLPLAEVVVSATGRAGLITGEMIRPEAVVIDVGSPKADVVLSQVKDKARFVTPVPGGVGPLTVTALMANVWQMAAGV